jgi:N4-gp56 family major capsid protein
MSQLWSTNSLGGYMYADNLSKELRMAVTPALRFRQFADIKDPDQQQRHQGATYHWNVFSKLVPASGLATRVLVETSTMPTGNFTITQGTLTISEKGISVPYTGVLDDLSEQPVKEIIHKVLKRDCKDTMDIACAAEFNKAPLRVSPANGTATDAVVLTTNGTATQTTAVALNKAHVKAIVDTMKERDIPAYTDDDYYCIAWPTTFRTLKNDLESIKQYTETGFGHIMRGEIGRYENCRFVEQTNVPKIGTGRIGTSATAWTASNWAVFFGADTVAEAIAIPEEIRGKIPGDYGRDKGIAWYGLNGFGICHTDAAQSRIVIWDSAAP